MQHRPRPYPARHLEDLPLPVCSALHIETPQYRQDHLALADYIAKGQIIWKLKDNWDELAEAMATYA